MTDRTRLRYDPAEEEPLSQAIVSVVTMAHHEDVLDRH